MVQFRTIFFFFFFYKETCFIIQVVQIGQKTNLKYTIGKVFVFKERISSDHSCYNSTLSLEKNIVIASLSGIISSSELR